MQIKHTEYPEINRYYTIVIDFKYADLLTACPFCGGKAEFYKEIIRYKDEGYLLISLAIMCSICKASSATQILKSIENFTIYLPSKYDEELALECIPL